MLLTKFGQPVFTRLEANDTLLIMPRIVFTWLTSFSVIFQDYAAMNGWTWWFWTRCCVSTVKVPSYLPKTKCSQQGQKQGLCHQCFAGITAITPTARLEHYFEHATHNCRGCLWNLRKEILFFHQGREPRGTNLLNLLKFGCAQLMCMHSAQKRAKIELSAFLGFSNRRQRLQTESMRSRRA